MLIKQDRLTILLIILHNLLLLLHGFVFTKKPLNTSFECLAVDNLLHGILCNVSTNLNDIVNHSEEDELVLPFEELEELVCNCGSS